jgi:uncharacterized membrane protein
VGRRESGQASILLLGAMLLCLAFVGLGVDGARMFTARRDLQNTADSAALAGAGAIDTSAYRSSGGASIALDPEGARRAAERIFEAAELPRGSSVRISVTPQRVTVQVRRSVPDTFLRVIGRDAETIGATATASPRLG